MVSERFPSGFRVVSEWFWRVPNLFEDLSGGLSRVFGTSKLSGGLSGGLSGELSRRFCALKAVRRVVRGFVRGVVRGFKPVWTQNMKTGAYAEPPLSIYYSSLRHGFATSSCRQVGLSLK